MQCVDTRSRRRRAGPTRVEELLLARQRLLKAMTNLVPRALILRLFLAPDDLFRVSVTACDLRVLLDRERIQLLDAHDRDAGDVLGAPKLGEIEVDLAAAKHDSSHRLVRGH